MLKAQVVAEDPQEKGRRIILNYGHTLGHAIEAATTYGTYLHGEAVAIGMQGEGMLSKLTGTLHDADTVLGRQTRLLERVGLPLKCPGVDPDAILQAKSAKELESSLRL